MSGGKWTEECIDVRSACRFGMTCRDTLVIERTLRPKTLATLAVEGFLPSRVWRSADFLPAESLLTGSDEWPCLLASPYRWLFKSRTCSSCVRKSMAMSHSTAVFYSADVHLPGVSSTHSDPVADQWLHCLVSCAIEIPANSWLLPG